MEHILSVIANWVMRWIATLGYLGVVLMMGIESACIPLPSEIIMPFSGALVLPQFAEKHSVPPFNLHLASLAGALGCAVGSAVAYYAGMYGGRPFLEKYGKYVLIRRKDIDRADAWFARWGYATVFFSRLLPVIRTFISFPAGVARMPFGRFLLYSFVGSVPWCYFLAYVGILVGGNLEKLRKYFHGADALIGVLIVAGVAYFIWHHLKPEREEDSAERKAA